MELRELNKEMSRLLTKYEDIDVLISQNDDMTFGALDALTRLTLQDECLRLFAKSDMTVFLITHDAREAVRLADRILVLDEGAITLDIPLTLSQPRAPEDPALAAAERRVLDAIFRRDATR